RHRGTWCRPVPSLSFPERQRRSLCPRRDCLTVRGQSPPAERFHPGEPAPRVRLPGRSWTKVPLVRKRKASEKRDKGSRRRRLAIWTLVALGALCIFISTISVWVRDIALDSDEWANTSSQLLQSENVRSVLSVYIVDQAYASSDAQARLAEALPEQ